MNLYLYSRVSFLQLVETKSSSIYFKNVPRWNHISLKLKSDTFEIAQKSPNICNTFLDKIYQKQPNLVKFALWHSQVVKYDIGTRTKLRMVISVRASTPVYFRFLQGIQFLEINFNKCRSSLRCWDSNSQPLEHEWQ